ncbi:hypothetical protein D3C87_1975790 [compost metagenome]
MPDQADAVFIISDDLVVNHQAKTDASAQCDHGEPVEPPPCTKPVLIFRIGNKIVRNDRRDSCSGLDQLTE